MSRRSQIAMSEEEVAAYLRSQITIIIVSNGGDGYPHPMPMHFCLEPDGAIAMTTYRKSQKVMNYRRDPRASLLVESGEEYEELRSVLIYARAEVIDDLEATRACMIACRAHSNGTRGIVPDAAEDARFADGAGRTASKRVVLKFHPQRTISWDHAKLQGQY